MSKEAVTYHNQLILFKNKILNKINQIIQKQEVDISKTTLQMHRPVVVLEMSTKAKGRDVIQWEDYITQGEREKPKEYVPESLLPHF